MHSDSGSRSTPDQLELGASDSDRAYVSELSAGSVIDEVYLVCAKEFRTTRTGKPFLKLRVRDRTGDLDCMVWENAEKLDSTIEVGDFALLNAKVSEYKGNVQLEAGSIQPVSADAVDPREFLPSTYRDVEELEGYLRFHIESVYDRDFRALLEGVFGDQEFRERFKTAPAAKQFHHAYLGGLLEHTVAVANLCDHISQQYGRVNRDLLITAAILHDVGKTRELSFDRTIDYTDSGQFLGHVTLGVMLVSEAAGRLDGFPSQKLDLLLHTLVSHHGELEWGSPKRPKTLEALIIHHVDNLDAKVKGFLEIVEGSRNAEWTDLRNLFRRPLHIPRANHQEEDFLPPMDPGGPTQD